MKNDNYTTPFGIAHYILLLAVGALCLGVIIYAAYWGPRATHQPMPTPVDTPVPSECARDAANTVAQMWAYHPEFIPAKYQNMVIEYLSEPVEFTTRGTCNDVSFTCYAGQTWRDCDPCALGRIQENIMQIHIADVVSAKCDY